MIRMVMGYDACANVMDGYALPAKHIKTPKARVNDGTGPGELACLGPTRA